MHLYKQLLPKKRKRLKKNPLKRRRRNQKKNQMKIWDSACLTKLNNMDKNWICHR